MPTTQVVSAMTPTYRVKAPARRRPSMLIRGPVSVRNRAFCFSAVQPHPAPGLPRRRCVRAAACSFTTRIECPPTTSARRSNTGRRRGSSPAVLPHLGCAHAQASTGSVCMCARAAGCRVQRCNPGLRRPVASRVDTAEMAERRVQLPHVVPDPSTRSSSSSSRPEERKPAATIGRRRNPSPTTFLIFLMSPSLNC